MHDLILILAFIFLSARTVYTQTAVPACEINSKCTSSAPCCLAYRQCGLGACYLSGCDSRSSFDLISCTAWPSRNNADFTFQNLNGLIANAVYLGDHSKANLKEITTICSSKPSDANVKGSKSFINTDYFGLEKSVAITKNNTISSSFYGSGDNPNYHPFSTESGTQSASTVPLNVQAVPGDVNGGVRGNTDGLTDNGTTTLSGGGMKGDGGVSKFSQGLNNQAANSKTEKAMSGSVLAIVVAFFALTAL